MAYEIFPQSINLYPEDQVYFRVRTQPPPVLWDLLTNVTVQSDHSLSRTSSGDCHANIVQRVHAGIAGVTWTFSSHMLPGSGGEVQLRLFGVSSNGLFAYISPTSTVVKDQDGVTLATVSHTVVAADEYYFEAAGHMLRMYINGQIAVEYTPTTATAYPIRASVDFVGTMASGTPKITVPAFTGVWDLDADSQLDTAQENTWSVSGGTLDDSTDVWKVLYTAGVKPGVYALSCAIEGLSLQTATAVPVIEPLSIDGPIALTLQPSEVVRFRTNYDRAQKKLVTWAVVSGSGSFTNDYFTAPSAPGTTVVKATYSTTQDARITITIPAVMTVTNPSSLSVDAAKLGEVLTLTTNMTGTINWTATIGTLSSSSGSSVTWTAPNQAGLTAKITATNGTYTVSQEIRVLNHFSYNPNTPLNWEDKRTLLVSRAEDRTVSFRIKDADEETYQAHEWDFRNRTVSEYGTVRTFWQNQYGKLPFIWDSPFRSVRHVFYFDSDIKAQATAGGCGVDYSFRVVEA
jgi:hypothetical protein